MTLYDQFIQDVQDNPQNHCYEVQLAVKRHIDDLERADTDGFPFTFDREKADYYIELSRIFKHTKGSWFGKPFNLLPFQAFIMSQIYGWVNVYDGLRKYYKIFVDMGRGGGKSEFAAMLQCIMFLFDGENTPNIVSFATTREQANFVFKPAVSMLRQLSKESDYVNKKIHIWKYHVEELETGGIMGTMTAEAGRNDGGDIFMGTGDEVHAHKDNSQIKIVETGQAKRVGSSPLLLLITTAGHNKQSPGYKYRVLTKQILERSVTNESFFGIVFKLDKKEEVHDKTKWIKSNPAIGSTPSMKHLEKQYVNATTEGESSMYEFMTKNMNLYVDAPKTWIENKFIKKVTVKKHPEELLRGRECYIGLDLSQDKDITAAPVLFLPTSKDPFFRVRWKFFCPKDIKIDGSKSVDGVDYRSWMKDNHIAATDGNVISYSAVENWILSVNSMYDLKIVEYDPKFKVKVIPQLQEKDIECASYSQGFAAMTGPLQFIYQGIVRNESSETGHKILLEENPVSEWMFANAVLVEKEGMKRISKDKSMNKVDGITALANAVGGYLTDLEEEKESVYEKRGILMI